MFNVKDRIKAIREIDGILANDYQYALQWYAPYIRVTFWNKFGAPQGYLLRTGDLVRHAAVVVGRSRQGCAIAEGSARYVREARRGAIRRSLLGRV